MSLEQIEINVEALKKFREIQNTKKQKLSKKEKKKKNIWDHSFNKSKLKKPNTTAVIFLRNNGKAEPMEAESRNGFFEIYGETYHEEHDCIYRMGKDGIPLAIIEENGMLPLGTRKWYERKPEERSIDFMRRKFGELESHLLKGIRNAELVRMGDKDGKKLSGKTIVALIILGIIGIVVFQSFFGG